MKFSTFIIIALLAVIAYALLRPAPSPSALQEILHLAQQLIPPATAGDRELPPAGEQTPPARDGAPGAPPAAPPSLLAPKSDPPRNANPSREHPHLTWDPFTKDQDAAVQKRYNGYVRQHLEGDSLLLRSGTRSQPDSGSEGDYVLTGYPGAADVPLDTQLEFSATSGGVVTYETDTETKTVLILVYSASGESNAPQTTPQPTQNAQPSKPGSWMWDQKGALDQGPYNRK